MQTGRVSISLPGNLPPVNPENNFPLCMIGNKMTSVPVTNLWQMLCNHAQQMLAMFGLLLFSQVSKRR